MVVPRHHSRCTPIVHSNTSLHLHYFLLLCPRSRAFYVVWATRVGDSATNIITPLMVYFPLILIFCQRWRNDFGIGSLTAMMLPYSLALITAGLGMTIAWVVLDLPLGPGAGVFIDTPSR